MIWGVILCYFVNQLKRRAVEVSEKRLTPKELEQFWEAKDKDVTNLWGSATRTSTHQGSSCWDEMDPYLETNGLRMLYG